jgi:integrase
MHANRESSSEDKEASEQQEWNYEEDGDADYVAGCNRISLGRSPEKELRHMMERLCQKAVVNPFGFHAIRHHVASVINDSGKASMKQIQVLLRHRRQSTTEIYLHAIGEGMRRAAILVLDEQSSTDSTLEKYVSSDNTAQVIY